MKAPPKEVYFVATDYADGEKKKFYQTAFSRLYGGRGYIKQFLKSHPNRPKRVYKMVGEWEEITDEF